MKTSLFSSLFPRPSRAVLLLLGPPLCGLDTLRSLEGHEASEVVAERGGAVELFPFDDLVEFHERVPDPGKVLESKL